jgi:hypothetical protein
MRVAALSVLVRPTALLVAVPGALLAALIPGPPAALVVGTAQAAPAPSATPRPGSTSGAAVSSPPGEVSWATAPANDRLGQDRGHFTYTLAAGTRITDALAVTNRSKATITLKVYASDAFTTSTGALDLLPAARKPVDVGSWISVSKPSLTLRPQQSAVVPFTLTVPKNATPGDHSGGVVTSLVTDAGDGSVQLDRRLGSRLYLRVPGTVTPLLEVSGVHVDYDGSVNPASSGTATVTYTVANAGNVRLRARQSVRLAGPFGLLGRAAKLPDLPELLPGSSFTRTATVHGVWPATQLTATVRLDPYTGPADPKVDAGPMSGSGTTWAWPWGQFLVVVLLAGAIAWARRQRRRAAAKVDAAIAAAVSEATAR